MTTLSLTDARNGLTDAVNRVYYGKERVAIRRRNKDVAVLVSVEDARLLERIENQARSKRFGKAAQASGVSRKRMSRKLLEDREDLAAYRARRNEPSIPWEQVKRKLGL